MEEIDFQELFYSFKKNIIIIIVITLIGIGIGVFYSKFLVTPMYKSSTTLVLAKSATSNTTTTSSESITQSEITLNQKLISTYSEIIKSRAVAKEVIINEKIDISIDEFISNISVSSKEGTEILEITVKNENSELAAKLANSIATTFTSKVETIYNIDNVSIIDIAEVAKNPYNMSLIKNTAMFGIGAFVMICAILFLFTYFSNTVKSEDELERILELRVLAVIPKIND